MHWFIAARPMTKNAAPPAGKFRPLACMIVWVRHSSHRDAAEHTTRTMNSVSVIRYTLPPRNIGPIILEQVNHQLSAKYDMSNSHDDWLCGYSQICEGGLTACGRPTILYPADASTSEPRGFTTHILDSVSGHLCRPTQFLISSLFRATIVSLQHRNWPSRMRQLWNAGDHALRWMHGSTRLSPWWCHANSQTKDRPDLVLHTHTHTSLLRPVGQRPKGSEAKNTYISLVSALISPSPCGSCLVLSSLIIACLLDPRNG
jgi:hypothetical protein